MKLRPQSAREAVYTGIAAFLPIVGQLIIVTRPALSSGAKARSSFYALLGSFILLMLIPVPDEEQLIQAEEPARTEKEELTTAASDSKEVTKKIDFEQQTSCGDVGEDADRIYPVYLDGADLDWAQRTFCGDAFATVREDTGADTVILASFDSLNKAQNFAGAVGGETGEPDFLGNRTEKANSPQPAQQPVYEAVQTYGSAPTPTSVTAQWVAPDGYDLRTTAEGIELAVQKQPGGLGCASYHYGCITYKVVFAEDCSSASATGVFLGKDGARVRDDYNIDSDVRANETLVWSFGFDEGDEHRATQFSLREIECAQY